MFVMSLWTALLFDWMAWLTFAEIGKEPILICKAMQQCAGMVVRFVGTKKWEILSSTWECERKVKKRMLRLFCKKMEEKFTVDAFCFLTSNDYLCSKPFYFYHWMGINHK
jgi:hypothetical protein